MMTGADVRRLRIEKRLSQQELAEIWGVSLRTVARLESLGDGPVPSEYEILASKDVQSVARPDAQKRPLALSDVAAYIEAHPQHHDAIRAILDAFGAKSGK